MTRLVRTVLVQRYMVYGSFLSNGGFRGGEIGFKVQQEKLRRLSRCEVEEFLC